MLTFAIMDFLDLLAIVTQSPKTKYAIFTPRCNAGRIAIEARRILQSRRVIEDSKAVPKQNSPRQEIQLLHRP